MRSRNTVLLLGLLKLGKFIPETLPLPWGSDSHRAYADLPKQRGLFVHAEQMQIIRPARAPVLGPTCVGQVEPEQFFIELYAADLVEIVDLED